MPIKNSLINKNFEEAFNGAEIGSVNKRSLASNAIINSDNQNRIDSRDSQLSEKKNDLTTKWYFSFVFAGTGIGILLTAVGRRRG